MSAPTPLLQAFGPLLFGRCAAAVRHAGERLRTPDTLADLYALCGELFPARLLAPSERGTNSRQRVFTPQVTFWAFVSQVLGARKSCREAVRKVEAWWRWAQRKVPAAHQPSLCAATSAYCQARRRLDPQALELIGRHLAWNLERRVQPAQRWLGGRAVKIVDGTTLSMPDTAANQARWPQSRGQKPGLGFPLLRLVGLFSLASGALLETASSNQHEQESRLFGSLWAKLTRGDVLLADRGFCSFALLASLAARGVDAVARLHQRRCADFRRGRRLGTGERLVEWSRPAQHAAGWLEAGGGQFAALPERLALRLIRVRVAASGFRTRTLVLATTLLDPASYPAAALAALYAERWAVEGHFRQIKTLLGLDVLRCKSPELVERELQVHQIAYNLVRALMQQAACVHRVALSRLSFQGSLDSLRHWSELIHAAADQPRRQRALIAELLALIARDRVPARPGRSEPRAKKRRAKNYQLLTKPRHQMGNLPHRNRPNRKPQIKLLS